MLNRQRGRFCANRISCTYKLNLHIFRKNNKITFLLVGLGWIEIAWFKTMWCVSLCLECVCVCVCSFVCRVAPHTVPSGLSPVVGTRCSVSSQHALGDCCCLHMYTGASASENHTPGLHSHARTYTHTQTQKNEIWLISVSNIYNYIRLWQLRRVSLHFLRSQTTFYYQYFPRQSETIRLYVTLT